MKKNRKDNQDLQQVKWMTMKENLELEHKNQIDNLEQKNREKNE